jgi:tRNA pseudouridine38-40 synthase
VGRGRLVPEDIDRHYEIRDRSKSGPTVPPQGLCMVSVEHEESFRLP